MRAVSPRGVEGTGVRAAQPSLTWGVGLWSQGLAFTSMGDTSSSTMQTQERHFQSLHLKATIHYEAENKAITDMPGFLNNSGSDKNIWSGLPAGCLKRGSPPATLSPNSS